MKKTSKNTNYWQVLNYFLYAIVIIFALFAISSKFSFSGIKILVVKSGSMEPAIKTGSLVIVKNLKEYKVGDVVTFQDSSNKNETITHRLIGEQYQNNIKVFTTQGDANGTPDSRKIAPGSIVGKVEVKIPYIGYLVAFARTPLGVILLIIIPATMIIYDEVINIKKHLSIKKPKEAK